MVVHRFGLVVQILVITFSAVREGSFTILEYDRPEELYSYLKNITKSHPDETSLINLGLTFEQRPIYCLKINKGNQSVGTIIAEFGAHAREWAGHASVTHNIHELLNNEKYGELITKITWYIVPLLNPDGFLYSKTEDRDWRKNRQPNPKNENCPGVDVNRNFPVKWSNHERTCQEDYGGSEASSERETLAIQRLFTLVPGGKVDIYLSVHTDAQCIILPYAYTYDRPKNYHRLYEVAKKMKNAMEKVGYPNYKIIQASQMYEVSGTVFDWVYDLKGVPLVFTLELPFDSEQRQRFRVDRSELEVIARQCMAALETCGLEVIKLNEHAMNSQMQTSTQQQPARHRAVPLRPTVNCGNPLRVTGFLMHAAAGSAVLSHLKGKMIEPVKLGVKANPPSLIFVYKMWGRLRMRIMPIRNLWPTTSTKFILEDVRARHDILLGVPDETIIKMIDVLKSLKAGLDLEEALAKHEQENKEKSCHKDSPENDHIENRLEEEKGRAKEKSQEVKDKEKETDGRKEKPYSFMDKRLTDEDTDFDLNDDLPLDELDGNSDDDFWR